MDISADALALDGDPNLLLLPLGSRWHRSASLFLALGVSAIVHVIEYGLLVLEGYLLAALLARLEQIFARREMVLVFTLDAQENVHRHSGWRDQSHREGREGDLKFLLVVCELALEEVHPLII